MKKSDVLNKMVDLLIECKRTDKDYYQTANCLLVLLYDLGFSDPCTYDQGDGCHHRDKSECTFGYNLEDGLRRDEYGSNRIARKDA